MICQYIKTFFSSYHICCDFDLNDVASVGSEVNWVELLIMTNVSSLGLAINQNPIHWTSETRNLNGLLM